MMLGLNDTDCRVAELRVREKQAQAARFHALRAETRPAAPEAGNGGATTSFRAVLGNLARMKILRPA